MLQRITKFRPAWDKRNPNPKKDYGIHPVQCFMVLKGKKGAVHFSFATGMLLESTMNEYIRNGKATYEMTSYGNHYLNKPMGFDVGYHSPKPMWKDQTVVRPTKLIMPKKKDGKINYSKVKVKKIGKIPKCEWLGKPCYCDGSAIRGEQFLKILVEKGSDEIWKLLEKDYKQLFKSKV